LAYQNYDIKFKIKDLVNVGTIASFIGFNTYIKTVQIKSASIDVNANKKQGFWAFEAFGTKISGEAPQGGTTVPNPLSTTSPIPPGSCVVTGKFNLQSLVISGNETKDIVIEVSLSTNKSFEWIDQNQDGWFQPDEGDQVVDMGIRGMIPTMK
jgi:hypothetical protein